MSPDIRKEDVVGAAGFIWWFGVVENRIDPLNLGRCQIRCFGWHNEDPNQIHTTDLPWAHPVVPFGVSNVQPPKEGTMVFGFFADGTEGRYPVLLGSVPGVPIESREPQEGFSDPLTAAQRSTQDQPRKVGTVTQTLNAAGPVVVNDTPKRFPEHLDEPTVSRLARPVKSTLANSNNLVARTESIANTTVEIQRRSRVANIVSSSGKTWDEMYPGYNATYPFNNVTETESGHAFEMDDTRGFERVQLSHRVGSTLEFLESGSVKMKAFKDKQDIVMRNHRSFVQGMKDETVHSDYYLKVAGKLVIHADSFELITNNDSSFKSRNIGFTSSDSINMFGNGDVKVTSAKNIELSAAVTLSMAGDAAGVRLTSPTNITIDGAISTRIAGADFVVNSFVFSIDSAVTQILPVSVPGTNTASAPGAARYNRKTAKPITKTSPSISSEKMDLIKKGVGNNL
jgi:Gp5 N-terminal OB domain